MKGTMLEPVKKEVDSITLFADSLYVKTPEDVVVAVDFLQKVSQAKKRIIGLFEEQKEATYRAWQTVIKKEKEVLSPLLAAENVIKQRKTEYDLIQLRHAEEMQRKEEERVRKEQEKLNKKLDKMISKTSDEEEIARLEEEKESIHVHSRVVPSGITKVSGSAVQKNYKVTVINKAALLHGILKGDIVCDLDTIVEIKVQGIKNYIKVSGNTSIPGCRVEVDLIQRIIG